MSTPKPFSHQAVSLKFFKPRPRVFDTSDPGTGKTPVEIWDFMQHRNKGGGPALVLVPKSLIYSAWGKDFATFAPDAKVSLAYAENRAEAFAVDADVYVTNHDATKWLMQQPPQFWKRFRDGRLVIDESDAYKHRTAQRSAAVGKIAQHFEIRRLMTGTPTTNGICDIWHQVFLLDDGKRLGKSFFQFRSVCCTPTQVGPDPRMLKWEDKPQSEAIVSSLISDITIRHQFDDCVDIPKNHQYSVPYILPPKHMKKYLEMERHSVLEISKMKTINAVNAAVLYGKLLQVCSGAIYDNHGSFEVLDTGRYELTLDLVEARRHSIVFFYWQHQRDALVAEAKRRGITYAVLDGTVTRKGERERIVQMHEAGFYRVLFAHPKSAAHGLTLVKSEATIWPSPTANLGWYIQGLKRIHRIGQTQKTETIVVVAPNTLEEGVYQSLLAKDVKMSDLLGYLVRRK